MKELEQNGKIFVVGIGPGADQYLTKGAADALDRSEVIVGYTVYVELLKDRFTGKEFITTPMKREVERCRLAFDEAKKGRIVSMVCSGDSGIYGMAGLMYEVSKEYSEVELSVIPGITAASGGAAVLGAPLMHDFAVISLSDLLTPWEKIEKRIEAASMADFVICIYNPSSKKRADYLKKACEIALQYKKPETVCGYVRNIGREEESYEILTLEELKNKRVDMFTTVYIGNEQTMQWKDKMITPRGYRNI